MTKPPAIPYLRLLVRLQTQQAADLVGLGVDDAGAHHVVRVRVDTLEQLHAEAHQFVARPRQVQRLLGLEDALGALLFAGDNIQQRL